MDHLIYLRYKTIALLVTIYILLRLRLYLRKNGQVTSRINWNLLVQSEFVFFDDKTISKLKNIARIFAEIILEDSNNAGSIIVLI